MVESLSKLAFFFRGGGKSQSARKSGPKDFGDHDRHDGPQRENRPVMRSPVLRRRRWSSQYQRRQVKGRVRGLFLIGFFVVGRNGRVSQLYLWKVLAIFGWLMNGTVARAG